VSIEHDLDRDPTSWRPQPGEKIVGTVVDLATIDRGYGDYLVVTLRTDDGDELDVHCYHTVLASELARLQPRVGERLGIKYLGRDDGRRYERYRVRIERLSDEPDWSKIRADADHEIARQLDAIREADASGVNATESF
jgi:hypothetical protein